MVGKEECRSARQGRKQDFCVCQSYRMGCYTNALHLSTSHKIFWGCSSVILCVRL